MTGLGRSKVAVVLGGPSPEHEISILSGLQSERLLDAVGLATEMLYWAQNGSWWLCPPKSEARDFLEGPPVKAQPLRLQLGQESMWVYDKGIRRRSIRPDVVLNCLHGGLGEGGGSQALFAMMGLPATGGSHTAAAVCMDKLLFSQLLQSAGISALPRFRLTPDLEVDLQGPFIVKPRFGGSSIGIEIVDDLETAQRLLISSPELHDGAVLEPYIEKLFDINLAFRTYPMFQLSEIERPARQTQGAIFSFADKYIHTNGLANAPREMPAKLPSSLAAEARALVEATAVATQITGLVRVDLLTDGETCYVNEVNGIPGALALYLWPKHEPEQLLLDCLQEAVSLGAQAWVGTVLRPGEALRAASGIASKLQGLRSGALS